VSVRLGVPLLDNYLIFLAGRCRLNTVLATAYDLKVFFTVVGKAPQDVVAADVLAFMTAQRAGQPNLSRLQLVSAADTGAVGCRRGPELAHSLSGRIRKSFGG
jgi:integrase/recombinase XerD